MSRSFLFVPGDSERKLDKARAAGADALIIDLEDSVAADARESARETTLKFLRDGASMPLWVRINPLDSKDAMPDLQAVMAAAPAGIVLPKAAGAAQLAELDEWLGRLEVEHGLPAGQTRVLPIVTERPDALFRLHEYQGVGERLAGMSWGAEDLSASVGASTARDEAGEWLPPYQLARSLCLFGAAAAGVAAIDTVFTNFRDTDGLARYAAAARRDGFTGMLAIHPAQLPVINEAFTPTDAELERARRIVALFEDNPGAGTLGMDGEMLDKPHLVQAKRLLQLAND